VRAGGTWRSKIGHMDFIAHHPVRLDAVKKPLTAVFESNPQPHFIF
jgi:hypothetical protein